MAWDFAAAADIFESINEDHDLKDLEIIVTPVETKDTFWCKLATDYCLDAGISSYSSVTKRAPTMYQIKYKAKVHAYSERTRGPYGLFFLCPFCFYEFHKILQKIIAHPERREIEWEWERI